MNFIIPLIDRPQIVKLFPNFASNVNEPPGNPINENAIFPINYLSYHLDNNRCHLHVIKESIVVYI